MAINIFNSNIVMFLRLNPCFAYFGRRLFRYFPFLLPHDKSYNCFKYLIEPKRGLFLDVGANDGISALGFHHICKNYDILSIEPNRLHEPRLKKLTKKIKYFNYKIAGLGNEACQKILYIPFYKSTPMDTMSSFDLASLKSSINFVFPPRVRDKVTYSQYPVNIFRMDDLGLKPDIIKIDAEGYDYQVLLGAVDIIRNSRPYFLIEYNPDIINDEETFLNSFDYKLFMLDENILFHPLNKKKCLEEFCRNKFYNIFGIPKEKIQRLPIKIEE